MNTPQRETNNDNAADMCSSNAVGIDLETGERQNRIAVLSETEQREAASALPVRIAAKRARASLRKSAEKSRAHARAIVGACHVMSPRSSGLHRTLPESKAKRALLATSLTVSSDEFTCADTDGPNSNQEEGKKRVSFLGLRRTPQDFAAKRSAMPTTRQHSDHGALASVGGRRKTRRQGVLSPGPESLVAPSSLVEHHNEAHVAPSNSLVEAIPVEDGWGQQEVVELSASEIARRDLKLQRESRRRQEEQQCHRIGCAIILAALGALIVSVGVILHDRNSPQTTATLASPPALPVASSTTAPTAPKSPAEVFRESLPSYTQESLQVHNSAQTLAYNWLTLVYRDFFALEEWRQVQLFALATFYYAFEGPHWPAPIRNDWMTDKKTECYWHSSKYGSFDESGQYQEMNASTMAPCTDNGELQALILTGLGLSNHTPTIPPEISLLSSLKILQLPNNGISTHLFDLLPSHLFQMDQLEELALYMNYFLDGPIPDELYSMSSLKRLVLSSTALSGTISNRIGLMTTLEWLDLAENVFSGVLPSELGQLTQLSKFSVAKNSLSGPLPTEIGLMVELEDLSLYENMFSNPVLPTEIGQLRKASTLYLGGMAKSSGGTIPSEMGLMTSLTLLSLGANMLSSSIPPELGLLSNLEWVSFYGNLLSGSIPSTLTLATKLEVLYLTNNLLDGTLPSELGSLTSLQALAMEGNTLSGVIPSQIGMLSELRLFDLSFNAFSGLLPSELWSLTNMIRLFLNSNDISGGMPSDLGVLQELRELSLSNTPMTGVLPKTWPSGLKSFILHDTLVTGSIPSTLGACSNLALLVLAGYTSSLTGPIPSELGQATELETLVLWGQDLTGTIPIELGALVSNHSLHELSLSDNSLKGTIPSDICALQSLPSRYLDFDCSSTLCGCNCTCFSN